LCVETEAETEIIWRTALELPHTAAAAIKVLGFYVQPGKAWKVRSCEEKRRTFAPCTQTQNKRIRFLELELRLQLLAEAECPTSHKSNTFN